MTEKHYEHTKYELCLQATKEVENTWINSLDYHLTTYHLIENMSSDFMSMLLCAHNLR